MLCYIHYTPIAPLGTSAREILSAGLVVDAGDLVYDLLNDGLVFFLGARCACSGLSWVGSRCGVVDVEDRCSITATGRDI